MGETQAMWRKYGGQVRGGVRLNGEEWEVDPVVVGRVGRGVV